MRGFRFVGRTAILTVFVLSSLAARAGDGKLHRMTEKVPNSYIVMLYKNQLTDAIGPELEKRHRGKLVAAMKDLYEFSIMLPNEQAAEAIARDPRVEEVQEDSISHLASCPRQLPLDGSQWSLAHLNDPNGLYWFNARVGDYLNSIRVFVIDTAIDDSLSEFRNPYGSSKVPEKVSVVPNLNYGLCSGGGDPGGCGGANCVVAGVFNPYHGTIVASLLAGNTYGVVPQLTSIVSIQAVDCQGSASDTAIAAAAQYAINNRFGMPAVANISLSNSSGSEAFDRAVISMVNNGIFVAGAVGNDNGRDSCGTVSPARVGGSSRYPGFMAAGATNIYGYAEGYSNTGNCVDLWAPGGATFEEQYWNPNNRTVATISGGQSGTSLAAPQVAGAAALIYSTHPWGWGPADVWGQMKFGDAVFVGGLRSLHIPDPGSSGCINTCNTTVCPPPSGY